MTAWEETLATERTQLALDEFARENGYLFGRALPGERGVTFLVRSIGAGQIVVGAEASAMAGVSDRYSYPTLAGACVAFGMWEMDGWRGEPYGWVRHQPSNRRRTYNVAGDLVDEWVAP
jgi:hypothetical protein